MPVGLQPFERRALATTLRVLRARRGLTQHQLADRSRLGRNYVSDVESGRHNPSWEGVVMMARGLGVSVAELAAEYEAEIARSED